MARQPRYLSAESIALALDNEDESDRQREQVFDLSQLNRRKNVEYALHHFR